MERIEQAFFVLLRSGLWNRKADSLSLFPLSAEDWLSVWKLASCQSVRGLVYRGILQLPDEVFPDSSFMIRWTAEFEMLEQRNRKMNRALACLLEQLQQHDVRPVVLKGQGIASFYAEPLLRECGDIDLCFLSESERKRTVEWAHLNGLNPVLEPDGSWLFSWKGLEVECHLDFFDANDRNSRKFLQQLMNRSGFSSVSIVAENEFPITVLPSVVNMVSLNLHLLKHLMGHGIGLRQFCDLARIYHEKYMVISGEELKDCYEHCGLIRWSRQVHGVLVRYLGLSPEELPYRERTFRLSNRLLRIILEGGNFGMYGSSRGKQGQPVWKRKWNTVSAFVSHSAFSVKYAPRESFGLILSLLTGNMLRK